MKDPRFPDWLEFFPCHPSDEKTGQIQNHPSPLLNDPNEPFEAASLVKEFEDDMDKAIRHYSDRRFSICGIVKAVEMDMHDLPSVQLSDEEGINCDLLAIFPEEKGLPDVQIGERVTITGNYLVYSHPLGVIMKYCEVKEKAVSD